MNCAKTGMIGMVAAMMALAACAGGQPRGPSDTVIERALAKAPGAAQPSTIVATEIAYARAARERGLDEAMASYAAPGAVLQRSSGPVPLTSIEGLSDRPGRFVEWGPRMVVKSCDGALAISLGRLRDAGGLVGNYATVWERQRDGSFRWTYDVAGRDDPQPAPREAPQEGDIVVTALNAVKGLVASCGRPGEAIGAASRLGSAEANAQTSADGTLRWGWAHGRDGTLYMRADYWNEGRWVTAIEERFKPAPVR